MSDSDSSGDNVELYRYVPSLVAAALFCGLFLVVSVLHVWKMTKTRTWYFTPMVLGGIFEVVGFMGRILGHWEREQKLGPKLAFYIIQAVFILIAPALFAASIYMILGRIIRFTHGEKYAIIRADRLTKVFVAGDVFAFTVQSNGAGLTSQNDPDKVSLGEKIVLGGLLVQVLWFGVFVVASMRFHIGINKGPTNESQALLKDPPGRFSWRTMLKMLYVTSALIMVRSIFRVVEYIEGQDGYLMSTEVWFYVLDASLMFLVLVIFVVVHPSNVFSDVPPPAAYSMTTKSPSSKENLIV